MSGSIVDQASEALNREAEFRDILREERLWTAFQPIVDLQRQCIFGYEALIRGPKESSHPHPAQLFTSAVQFGLESEFEIICRKNSIRTFAELGLSENLFLNISPLALLNPNFKKGRTLQYLKEYGVDPRRVVIEVTEHHKTQDFDSLREALCHYRNMGFKVALDDFGEGYSSLRLWNSVLPDYIKVDKHFIRGIHRDRMKSSFVSHLHRMAAASNCKIIAEGVEEMEECRELSALGLNYAQGYYFALPEAKPPRRLDKALFRSSGHDVFMAGALGSEKVSTIARYIEPRGPQLSVKKILEHFQQHPELQILPIVERGQPLGLIERSRLFNLLMETQYGVELYGKHPIARYLNDNVMMVDMHAPLESVSLKITSLASGEQSFVVTQEGRYFGVGTVLDLLETITEQKVRNARHANPLTLLPGVVPINNAINCLLAKGSAFAVAYFDLDNFKPYNDSYGYDCGDKVIQLVARLLSMIYGPETALVGHIGGDDFIVVDSSSDYLKRCQRILQLFKQAVIGHYHPEHIAAGGIQGRDRKGEAVFYPLLSISVGIVPPAAALNCRSHLEIADLASEAKKIAKQEDGDSLFVNRRSFGRGH